MKDCSSSLDFERNKGLVSFILMIECFESNLTKPRMCSDCRQDQWCSSSLALICLLISFLSKALVPVVRGGSRTPCTSKSDHNIIPAASPLLAPSSLTMTTSLFVPDIVVQAAVFPRQEGGLLACSILENPCSVVCLPLPLGHQSQEDGEGHFRSTVIAVRSIWQQ